MTPRKTKLTIGRRPTVDEALQGWWRISDSPAGRLRPESLTTPKDMPALGDPFDYYCFGIVNEALVKMKTRCPAIKCEQLLRHMMQCAPVPSRMGEYPELFRQAYESFRLYELIAYEERLVDGKVQKVPVARPADALDMLGLTAVDAVKASYRKFLRTLGAYISEAEPHIEATAVELAS